MPNMEFAKWLKVKLDERGLNPTQFADAIKENQPTIQRILSGETKNPRLKIIKKIEDYFSDKFEQDKTIVIAGKRFDTHEQVLIKNYMRLSPESRDHIDYLINKILSAENPKDKTLNPYPNKPIKEKVKNGSN